jgi:hypothetical protein
MVPSHYPILVALACGAACDDTPRIESLLATNLGPLLDASPSIVCSRVHTHRLECEVYAPRRTACASCRQLRETFTIAEDATPEIDCALVARPLPAV